MLFRAICLFGFFDLFIGVGSRYVDSLPKFCVLACRLQNFSPRSEALTDRCVCVGGDGMRVKVRQAVSGDF